LPIILEHKKYFSNENLGLIKFYYNKEIESAMLNRPLSVDKRVFVFDNELPYLCGMLPSLWRKETMIKFIIAGENAYHFEFFGTERMRKENILAYFSSDFSIAQQVETLKHGEYRGDSYKYFELANNDLNIDIERSRLCI
jgi:hypothetical protein